MFSSSCSYFKEEILYSFAKWAADRKSRTIKQWLRVGKKNVNNKNSVDLEYLTLWICLAAWDALLRIMKQKKNTLSCEATAAEMKD